MTFFISVFIKPPSSVSLSVFLSASLIFWCKYCWKHPMKFFPHYFQSFMNMFRLWICKPSIPSSAIISSKKINLISLEEIRYWLKYKNCFLHGKTGLDMCMSYYLFSFCAQSDHSSFWISDTVHQKVVQLKWFC